jgi:hypothetical protein
MACRIHCAVRVCKPPGGAVFKRHGVERSGKRSRLKRDQVCVKKLNANEPLMKCRKDKLVGKTVGFDAPTGLTVTDDCLLVTDQPALRWQELYAGFYMKREKLPLRCADMPYILM